MSFAKKQIKEHGRLLGHFQEGLIPLPENFLKYAKRSLYDRIKKKLLISQDGFSLYPVPNQIIAKGQGYCNDE